MNKTDVGSNKGKMLANLLNIDDFEVEGGSYKSRAGGVHLRLPFWLCLLF